MHDSSEPIVDILVSGDFKRVQLVPEPNEMAKLGRLNACPGEFN
jgi:hypothetical protein